MSETNNTPTVTPNQSLRRGAFCIDDGPVYDGYTDGTAWNGWAKPYFQFEQANEILKQSTSSGEWEYVYLADVDCFLLDDKVDDDLIEIHGEVIIVDNQPVKAYSFNLGWIWDEIAAIKGGRDE